MTNRLSLLLLAFLSVFANQSLFAQSPNILLVIADDLGVDYLSGYHDAPLQATTPTIDSLMGVGLTFRNAVAMPVCSPTRAAIMSGKHGHKTGVTSVPGNLDTSHFSLFRAIEAETNGAYADAVIGKWHLSQPQNPDHPSLHGVDHFSGVLSGAVSDYFAWDKLVNGVSAPTTTYATTAFTDDAITWIDEQTQPWFLWLSHVAPHSPYHVPPDSLYTIAATGNNRRQYVAMVEALDHEIGRLLDSMPDSVRDNTLILFVGDNGTPGNILQDYPTGHGKGSLYQGGIRVPFIATGAGVTRKGESEDAMVHVVDLYATILEATGVDLPGGRFNSLSFYHLLDGSPGNTRDYNFVEIGAGAVEEFAIRNSQYKLIEEVTTGNQEFYDLIADSLETNDLLLGSLTTEQASIKLDLEAEAAVRLSGWSCRDHIQNGDEEGIDCGGSSCEACNVTSIVESTGVSLSISPNPSEAYFHLLLIHGRYQVQVTDLRGSVIATEEFQGSQHELNLQELTSGLYVLQVFDLDSGQTASRKIRKW